MRLDGHTLAHITRALNDAAITCPSAADPARNRHRPGTAWQIPTVQAILGNPVYTGHATALQRASVGFGLAEQQRRGGPVRGLRRRHPGSPGAPDSHRTVPGAVCAARVQPRGPAGIGPAPAIRLPELDLARDHQLPRLSVRREAGAVFAFPERPDPPLRRRVPGDRESQGHRRLATADGRTGRRADHPGARRPAARSRDSPQCAPHRSAGGARKRRRSTRERIG